MATKATVLKETVDTDDTTVQENVTVSDEELQIMMARFNELNRRMSDIDTIFNQMTQTFQMAYDKLNTAIEISQRNADDYYSKLEELKILEKGV